MESNQPEFSSPPSAPAPAGGNERIMAIASLVLGVINLCAWFFPICGLPLGFIGIVLGVLGMKDQSQKTIAVIGIALCLIGVLLACVNSAIGAYMGYTGQGFQFPQ
jgi:membrane-bound ClpP family serine protease